MAHMAPALPTRFPCWVRATYSWGGESKKDLGFMEGDLIECLNAGDGSWWMGRLHRDKRAVGLFPSNFVKVLDESFQPVSRASSPMPSPNGSVKTPSPQKTKTFRKPFQAYVETGAKTSSPKPATSVTPAFQPSSKAPKSHSRHTSSRDHNTSPSRQSSYLDSNTGPTRQLSFLQGSASPSRQPSYLDTSTSPTRRSSNLQDSWRPTSPHPEYVEDISPTRQPSYVEQSGRASSPQPYPHYGSRAPSPAPPAHYGSRASSPAPAHYRPASPAYGNEYEDVGCSPPPPPPPAHRVPYNAGPSRQPSPTPSMNDRYPQMSRGPSPAPPSPAPYSSIIPGMTPSPLRDAMDDVMSSLEGMALRRDEPSPSPEQEERKPLDPWSPESFKELQAKPRNRPKQRPRSSLGIASSQRDIDDDEEDYQRHEPNFDSEPPQLHDYVERMEIGLRNSGAASPRPPDELFFPDNSMAPPMVPPKHIGYQARPSSSSGPVPSVSGSIRSIRGLKNRKSAYELGRSMLDRTFTTKSSATNSSAGVQSVATNATSSTDRTSQSIMSGYSAGGFSATSAGSLAKRKWGSIRGRRPQSVVDVRNDIANGFGDAGPGTRPQTPSHYSNNISRPVSRAAAEEATEDHGGLGGLITPRKKKSGFFKKLVESAKTGAASARGTIASGQVEAPRSPIKSMLPNGVTAIAGGNSAARDMGLGGGKSDHDWVQVRRDVNRSNSLSRNEKMERIERCQMMDYPVIAPIDVLLEDAEGDEDMHGQPVRQLVDFQSVNLQLVDKSARFVNSLPPMTNATSLAQGYVCRPYRSEVQKLRAIFTWVSEKIGWEEDFEGDIDTRRVIQMRRGCSEEVAVLVSEMCSAAGLHCEIVRGFLKTANDIPDGNPNVRPNHWWNAVTVEGSWRIIDCSLASPTNPKRSQYSSASHQIAESGFFLARPMEICYTHIPTHYAQQHIVPPIPSDILLALPCASPPYFKHSIQLLDYDTSLLRIENLELVHIQFTCAPDIECVASVEARAYAHDLDGDVFESGDTTTTRALAQADWAGGQKRYTVKAHLPSNGADQREGGQAVLKVYAGKRGLMHSVKDNPHPLVFALPIVHQGTNPPYEFLLRHPTPHAQRHDLYVAQPQCRRLAINNTFVFAIRQHPSSLSVVSPNEGSGRAPSPSPFARPNSALSMMSSVTGSNAGSDYFSQASSNSSGNGLYGQQQQKPAKLAIQAPSGKILRLLRKSDNSVSAAEAGDGGVWETIIKVGERGVWRGLVLADRSARWCVFGEWECI